MYKIYKSTENGEIIEINNIEKHCWVDMINPSEDEMIEISKLVNVDVDFIKPALDEEEIPRVEYDDETDSTLILVQSPLAEFEREHRVYDTLPLGIIHCPIGIITVTSEDNAILRAFRNGSVRTFFIYKKSRFIMQILYRNATLYLTYLRQIEKQTDKMETELHKSMKNKELIQLLDLEKSLVYFSTSLKSNEIVLKRLTKIPFMNKYEEDTELLEDIVIENEQAIEMAKIYSDILSSTMNAFASIISNNLNIVMKFLASITIVMAIPTMIASFVGMNVNGIPFSKVDNGFFIICYISFIVTIFVAFIMFKKKMFS